jgi:hypothetical protein
MLLMPFGFIVPKTLSYLAFRSHDGHRLWEGGRVFRRYIGPGPGERGRWPW